jgi:lipoic acid synthetase
VTSVTRDDLPLGGAPHFRHAAEAIRRALPSATVEMLTPDFQGDEAALQHIADAPMAVFNHNMETVASLFPAIRPQADYRRSLGVLRRLREWRPESMTKSGFMLGLGETADEVKRLLDDLCTSGVMAVIIGQYLRPRLAKTPVVRYAHPDEFIAWRDRALSMGFRYVASAPLVRSSYHADSFTAD